MGWEQQGDEVLEQLDQSSSTSSFLNLTDGWWLWIRAFPGYSFRSSLCGNLSLFSIVGTVLESSRKSSKMKKKNPLFMSKTADCCSLNPFYPIIPMNPVR